MPTPGQTAEEAYKKYSEALQQYGDENHEAVKSAYDAWQKASADAESARQAGVAQVRTSLENSLNEGIGGVEAILKEGNRQVETAQQEAVDQQQREQKAAMWTGAGEVAASLANLIAVGGFNAVPQQYKQYSQDWMKKAEENWKQNRARIDNMRERQRAIQQQLIQMKMNAGSTLANFDLGEVNAANAYANRQADARLKSAVDLAGIKGQTAQAVAQAGLQGATTKLNLDVQEQARKDAKAQHAAQIDLQYDLHGWTKDPKSGRRVAPPSSDTKGGSSNITISIAPAKKGEKGTRMTINSGSLLGTINANRDLLKADDVKAIDRVLRDTSKSADEKGKELQQYIKTSPELLRLLKISSSSWSEFDWNEDEENPQIKAWEEQQKSVAVDSTKVKKPVIDPEVGYDSSTYFPIIK